MQKGIWLLMSLILSVAVIMITAPGVEADVKDGDVIFNPTDDASIWEQYPDDNYGSADYMLVRNKYGHPTHEDYWEVDALIKFDLSGLTDQYIVDSAWLYLYYFDCDFDACEDRELTCYSITSDWGEGTVTFNTKPSFTTTATSSSVVPATWGWMRWDVTSDVQDYVAGLQTNYGWQVMDTTTWGDYDIPGTRFRTKEYGDYSPYLKVTYRRVSIPSLTEYGLIVLVILIVFSTWVLLRRRKAAVSRP
jgi:hypothetical protein